uniref:Predicted protein n=1 Tax=Hordeum vulgare subsp. vulgare TaxID=112509 RepID=F2DB17_HORVV|nr:predicted protein [Hordeum vulgare subsp. vulgare]
MPICCLGKCFYCCCTEVYVHLL